MVILGNVKILVAHNKEAFKLAPIMFGVLVFLVAVKDNVLYKRFIKQI